MFHRDKTHDYSFPVECCAAKSDYRSSQERTIELDDRNDERMKRISRDKFERAILSQAVLVRPGSKGLNGARQQARYTEENVIFVRTTFIPVQKDNLYVDILAILVQEILEEMRD